MTTSVTPFLLFDGCCAEAMTFYQSCLGGELTLTRLGDTPMAASAPAEHHHRIVYAQLCSEAIEISATDWLHPTRQPLQGNTVALRLTSDDLSALETAFTAIRVGADPDLLDELREMPFGWYGHLADRFGVHWFFRS